MTGIKFGFFSLLLFGFLFQANNLLNWRSPEVNLAGERDICKYIEQTRVKLSFELVNKKSTRFYVDLVKNCQAVAINPYFPAIHIKTRPECNAWLHIVYTDAKEPKLKAFIDAPKPDDQYSTYPFYTRSKDFCDAPLWTYGLFSKPLSFWKGHAFALRFDDKNKTIKCLGGVEWGFELHWTKLRPVAIMPKLLDETVWLKYFEFFQKKLADYRLL